MQVPCQNDIVTVPLSRNEVCVTQQCLNIEKWERWIDSIHNQGECDEYSVSGG
jgi:hypothetical protein